RLLEADDAGLDRHLAGPDVGQQELLANALVGGLAGEPLDLLETGRGLSLQGGDAVAQRLGVGRGAGRGPTGRGPLGAGVLEILDQAGLLVTDRRAVAMADQRQVAVAG